MNYVSCNKIPAALRTQNGEMTKERIIICIKSRKAEAYSVFGCVSEVLAAMGTCCTADGGRE